MNDWALPTIALLLIGYGAVSARLRTTMVSQAMIFTAAGLLAGSWALDLVDVDVANRYADWYAAHARDHPAMPESAPVAEQRFRDRALAPTSAQARTGNGPDQVPDR